MAKDKKKRQPVIMEYDEESGEYEVSDDDDTMQDTVDDIVARIMGKDTRD